MKKERESICAIVVSYNRKRLLIECLQSLLKQTYPLTAIYLIDNLSTDGTPDMLKEFGFISELPPSDLKEPWEKEFKVKNYIDEVPIVLHYVRMHENIGGAGGFFEGIKRAYEKGYDWFWLMDDDAEPKNDAMAKLMEYKKQSLALCNLKIGIDGNPQYHHCGWKDACRINDKFIKQINKFLIQNAVMIDFSSFVGLLIHSKLISLCGYPKKEFFIHHDDVEYSFRINKISKILLVTDSIIIHKDQSKKNIGEKRFLWKKKIRMPFNNFWLTYYGLRNLFYLKKKECGQILSILVGFRILPGIIRRIILYDDYKFKRIRLVISAFLDGIKERFDNDKPKKILYK